MASMTGCGCPLFLQDASRALAGCWRIEDEDGDQNPTMFGVDLLQRIIEEKASTGMDDENSINLKQNAGTGNNHPRLEANKNALKHQARRSKTMRRGLQRHNTATYHLICDGPGSRRGPASLASSAT
ncbi:hypothetical protein LX36DRAFT_666427 [Colletotrichum falcatum]|nr:hypothetical protein LX36DRAFT_666427 [Colletotrichum falcatum]